ncbi:MAG: MFS transporter, partial [Fusobacteriaceae bacterium]|nr:MFS transporter [Fusobacteriaceae bacterium]
MLAKKELTWISSFYMLFFMAGGVVSQYLPIFYSYRNYNYSKIGIILSIGSIFSVLFQPIAATISDKVDKKIKVFRILIICTFLAASFLFFLSRNYYYLLIIAGIFYGFSGCLQPLNDSIVIEMCTRKNYKYQTIRLLGSLGFAIMSAITGVIASYNIIYIFPMYIGILIIALFISYHVPTVEKIKSGKVKSKFIELIHDKKFVFLLFYAFILSITNAFFNSFQGIYSRENGISMGLLGICSMIGSISQFPAMAFFSKAYKKFGQKKLMTTAGVVFGLRWLCYATILNSTSVLILWAIHGLTYILLFLCLVEYSR